MNTITPVSLEQNVMQDHTRKATPHQMATAPFPLPDYSCHPITILEEVSLQLGPQSQEETL